MREKIKSGGNTPKIVAAMLVTGLLLTISASALLETPRANQKPFDHQMNLVRLDKSIQPISSPKVQKIENQITIPRSTDIPTAYLNGDVQLTFGSGFDIQPTIANDGSGNLVVGMIADLREEGEYNAWFTSSPDAGETWADNAVGWVIETPEYPDIDYWGEGARFVGTMVPSPYDAEGSTSYVMECTNPSDFDNGYSLSGWDWYDVGDGYYNFISASIGGDNAAGDWAFGGISIVGDHGSGVTQTPFFVYQCTEDGYAWIYRWSTGGDPDTFENGQDTGMTIDPITHMAYPIWNFINPVSGNLDLLFAKFDFATWEDAGYAHPVHPQASGGTLETTVDDEYMDISAYNNNVIIVSQTAGDISCYYSSNGLSSVDESTIAATGDDETSPRIVHIGENEAICIYVKNGNLYSTKTDDGGATWSPPNQINDEDGDVNPESGNADICSLGVVWSDNRNGNYDIYFDTPGVAAPLIKITAISGGLGVSAVIENGGTADATDVQWSIGLDGFVFPKFKNGTIPTLAAGATETVSAFVLGLGSVDITVTADSAIETATGSVLLIFVTGVS